MGVIAGHDRHGGRLWHRRPHRGSDLLRVHQERVVGCAVDLGLPLFSYGDSCRNSRYCFSALGMRVEAGVGGERALCGGGGGALEVEVGAGGGGVGVRGNSPSRRYR